MRDVLDTSCLEGSRSGRASQLAAASCSQGLQQDLSFPLPQVKNVRAPPCCCGGLPAGSYI